MFSTSIPLYIQIHLCKWDSCYKYMNHKISNFVSHPLLCKLYIAAKKIGESEDFQDKVISFEFK